MTTDSIVSTVDNAGPATAPPISKEAERRGEATEVGPPRPRAFGFDVQRLNQEFALVLMGSKAVVFLEQPAAPLEDQKPLLPRFVSQVPVSNGEYLPPKQSETQKRVERAPLKS